MTASDLHAVGAMAALLKDALKPNMIQTLEHTGVLVHGGTVCKYRPWLQQRKGNQDSP